MPGKLIVISGLSAAGKGTIAKELITRYDNFVLSISATTREKRGNEIDGQDYFFVTKNEFEDMIKNDELLEYANYVNNFYGTPKKYVNDMINKNKNVILEIEMQGALQVKKIFDKAVLIFFIPKDAKTQRERLISRNRETVEQIEERIRQAIIDADYAKYYDFIIVNDDIEVAIKDVENIVNGTYDKNKNEQNLKILDKIVKDIKEEQNV
ncbi:MAG: guanylate kinase [Lachnospiraceae bacterium]|nr:guanylate kinase [Lachnospiraceae bacterium]